jgi:hypothetical protein
MTSTEPFCREVSAVRGAMILDCFARVVGTARIKATPVAEQGAHGKLVKAQQSDQCRLHKLRAFGQPVACLELQAAGQPHASLPVARLRCCFNRSRGRGLRMTSFDLVNCPVEQAFNFLTTHVSKRRRLRARHCLAVDLRMQPKQDVPATQFRTPDPECLTREPLDQVTRDGARRELLADHQAEPRLVSRWLAVQDKMRGPAPRAQTKNG